MEQHEVYLVLTRSHTLLSRLIHQVTQKPYTHAGICLDGHLTGFYTFGRRYTYSIWPAGLTEESLLKGVFQLQSQSPCAIYRLRIDHEQYLRLKRLIQTMYAHRNAYKYHFLGIVKCQLGIIHKRPYYYFCSQFVAEVLENAQITHLPKDPSLMQPCDLTMLEGLECVYEGTVADLCRRLDPQWHPSSFFLHSYHYLKSLIR